MRLWRDTLSQEEFTALWSRRTETNGTDPGEVPARVGSKNYEQEHRRGGYALGLWAGRWSGDEWHRCRICRVVGNFRESFAFLGTCR